MGLVHKAHGAAVRLLWRILAPRHPRGWLDLHAVFEESGKTLWIHTHGMERWGLPNVELVGVPPDLGGYAHGLLMHVAGYMKGVKPILPDENFGGKFAFEEQMVIQLATVRQSPNADHDHRGMLRVVDYKEPVTAGVPRKLIASYLIATAEKVRATEKKITMLREAIGIFRGDPEVPAEDPDDAGPTNPNNYFGWEYLGTVLCESNREAEGVRCLEEAVARWPAGARSFSTFVKGRLDRAEVPRPEKSALTRFWITLDADAARTRVLARTAKSQAST